MTGWYASPAVADLDGDDDLEIVVASTSFGSDEEWYVYEHDGTPFAATWSQNLVGTSTSGVFGVALGDLDNDGDLDYTVFVHLVGPHQTVLAQVDEVIQL
jgi:hypothetical protein